MYAKRQELSTAYVYLTTRYITQHRIFIKFSGFFHSYFVLPNLTKQLFHSHLLDMRLVIASSALRASLAIYHFISNARSWNNC